MSDDEAKPTPQTQTPPKAPSKALAKQVSEAQPLVAPSLEEARKERLRLVQGQSVEKKDDATIKAWAERKSLELLPAAVAELSFNLKYGNDKQRAEAMRDVMDINGMRKRDVQAGMQPTIILNLAGGLKEVEAKLPWLKKSTEEGDEE